MTTITIYHYLLVCPLVFLAGLVDAIAGGGGLISLPAYLISGLPVHNAIATNKMSSCLGTSIATARYAHDGFINWKLAPLCVIMAFIGSRAGSTLALMVDDGVFKIIMLVILPATAVFATRGKALTGEKEPYPMGKTLVLSMFIAAVIGVYDGFYGPGTGTFLILFLTAVAHMKLSDANGVTKVINLTTNIAALTVFIANGKVIYLLGIPAGLFSIAGNYVGTRFFEKGGAKAVKPVMVGVLAVFFVKTVYELVTGA